MIGRLGSSVNMLGEILYVFQRHLQNIISSIASCHSAMVHQDHKTQVGSHRIFSVVLVPSSVCPRSSSLVPAGSNRNKVVVPWLSSMTVSVFSSSAALFGKMKKGVPLLTNNVSQQKSNNRGAFNRMKLQPNLFYKHRCRFSKRFKPNWEGSYP